MSHEPAGAAAASLPIHRPINGALILLLVLYAAIIALQPTFAEPSAIMVFLRRAAPLVVLACGQLPVLLTGGFDLSAGAVVTLTVLGGSMLTDGDPGRTWMAIPLLVLCGPDRSRTALPSRCCGCRRTLRHLAAC